LDYPIPLLLTIGRRLLEGVICDVLHRNLMSIDLSYLVLDLKRLNETLSRQHEAALKRFLTTEGRVA